MIYLASTSPRRRALLKKAGVSFRILKPDYHEGKNDLGSPSRRVVRHALGKALSCKKYVEAGTILAADTLVFAGGEGFGKPRNLKEARLMLGKLQGRWHVVYTGVAILKIGGGRVLQKKTFFEKTRVRIKKLSSAGIGNYFKSVFPLDKAGAYAIQSPTGGIVEAVRGFFTNAVGLPVEKVLSKIRKGNLR